MHLKSRRMILAFAAVMTCTPTALALIKVLLPLQRMIRDSQYIVVAKVERFYPDKPAMLLHVEEDLKGKMPARKFPVHLKGDKDAEKLQHVPQLLKRLGPDLPIILFIEAKMDKNDPKMTALAYTNGTWMQLVGDRTGADSAVWSLTHGEPYLRRTYKGPTDELRKTLVDVLAGKKAAPPLDKKEPPGFGPEVRSP